MKKIKELPKDEKVMLLKSIASGEVDRKDLTPDAIIVSSSNDSFLGLMVAASSKETGEGANVVFIGEGAKGLETLMKCTEHKQI